MDGDGNRSFVGSRFSWIHTFRNYAFIAVADHTPSILGSHHSTWISKKMMECASVPTTLCPSIILFIVSIHFVHLYLTRSYENSAFIHNFHMIALPQFRDDGIIASNRGAARSVIFMSQ